MSILLDLLLPTILYIIISIISVISKQKIKASFSIQETDLALIKGVNYNFYKEFTENMKKEGFLKSLDYLSTNGSVPGYVRILKNFNENIKIQIIQLKNTITIFIETKYEDGSKVLTTNKLLPSIFKNPSEIVYRHAVTRPQELLYHHREHIKKFFTNKNVDINYLKSDDKEEAITTNENELKNQEKYEILKLDNSKEYYKYTVFGATRTVSRLLFFKWFKYIILAKSKS